jgi:CheY-like chemotaxis protein
MTPACVMWSLYLQCAGYQVACGTDGSSALESLWHQLPDLLILDLMLPAVDGYEIARFLREQGDTPLIHSALDAFGDRGAEQLGQDEALS